MKLLQFQVQIFITKDDTGISLRSSNNILFHGALSFSTLLSVVQFLYIISFIFTFFFFLHLTTVLKVVFKLIFEIRHLISYKISCLNTREQLSALNGLCSKHLHFNHVDHESGL